MNEQTNSPSVSQSVSQSVNQPNQQASQLDRLGLVLGLSHVKYTKISQQRNSYNN